MTLCERKLYKIGIVLLNCIYVCMYVYMYVCMCVYVCVIYIYYIDTDIYARFFSCEKPFRDMFLTNVIQSES